MSELKLEGDKEFAKTPTELFGPMTRPEFLVECIPDVTKTDELTEESAKFVIRPGFSFVRGTLNVELKITDKTEPESVTMKLDSKGIGSSSSVTASVSLVPSDSGTSAHWVAEVTELGGLLKLAPRGLLLGAAQRVLEDLWNRVEQKLDEGDGQE